MNSLAVLKQNPEMITRTIDGQAVIMDPQEGKVLTLNEVGTLIWETTKNPCDREDILTAICCQFDVCREEAASDLEEFTVELMGKGLLLLEE